MSARSPASVAPRLLTKAEAVEKANPVGQKLHLTESVRLDPVGFEPGTDEWMQAVGLGCDGECPSRGAECSYCRQIPEGT